MEVVFPNQLPNDVCLSGRRNFYETMNQVVVYIQSDKLKSPSKIPSLYKEPETYLMTGTGVMIHNSGLVLTAFHVVENAKLITVNRKGEFDAWAAKVIASDVGKDLALLRILDQYNHDMYHPTEVEEFNYARFAENDEITNGQLIFGIGNPSFFTFSLFRGEVTNCRVAGEVIDYQFDNDLRTFSKNVALLQINNSHNCTGSSGAPFFDSNGRVIGIMVFTSRGFDFAVPLKSLNEFVNSNMPEDLNGNVGNEKKKDNEKGNRKRNRNKNRNQNKKRETKKSKGE